MAEVGGNFYSTSTDTTHADVPQMGADTGVSGYQCVKERERGTTNRLKELNARGTEPFKQNDVVSYQKN